MAARDVITARRGRADATPRRSYAACLELALQHVTAGHVALVVATHNAGSVRHAARRSAQPPPPPQLIN